MASSHFALEAGREKTDAQVGACDMGFMAALYGHGI